MVKEQIANGVDATSERNVDGAHSECAGNANSLFPQQGAKSPGGLRLAVRSQFHCLTIFVSSLITVALIMGYYRNKMEWLEERHFKELIPLFPPFTTASGKMKKCSPFGQYLECARALFTIAVRKAILLFVSCQLCRDEPFVGQVGYSGGQRARLDIGNLSLNDFWLAGNVAIWVVQNGLHKQTRCKNGKIVRRMPYLILDQGRS